MTPLEAQFQFTHPGRGATIDGWSSNINISVSIHAPREGCDTDIRFRYFGCGVSIHAPREGCDLAYNIGVGRFSRFNSRTPGGVRRYSRLSIPEILRVSIHAPREGCDREQKSVVEQVIGFNSRTPGGVRLEGAGEADRQGTVSIHAPREGCDGDQSDDTLL